MYRKSRYEGRRRRPGVADRQYAQLIHDLKTLPRHQPKDFELDARRNAEGCLRSRRWPIAATRRCASDRLPVGLRHRSPHHALRGLQLRENAEGTAFNLVGFQTRLTWPAQKEAFGKLPGMANAEWLRLGGLHRNTFLDSPRLLDASLRLRGHDAIWFAGQITGAEGYVEAAACGMMTGTHAARQILGLPPVTFPRESALGAVVAHLQNTTTPDFQPANVTWAPFPELDRKVKDKKERRGLMAARALAAIDAFRRRRFMHSFTTVRLTRGYKRRTHL